MARAGKAGHMRFIGAPRMGDQGPRDYGRTGGAGEARKFRGVRACEGPGERSPGPFCAVSMACGHAVRRLRHCGFAASALFASTLSTIVTLSSTITPPLSRVLFQLMPQSLRLTVVVAAKPALLP